MENDPYIISCGYNYIFGTSLRKGFVDFLAMSYLGQRLSHLSETEVWDLLQDLTQWSRSPNTLRMALLAGSACFTFFK